MRPTAFVTYAHDSEQHEDDVLRLATLLQESGVETDLDQWESHIRRDWSSWAIEGMTSADYVIVVVSPDYRTSGDGLGAAAVNRGVQSEAAVLRDLLHSDRTTWLPKLLPVVLPGHGVEEIPYFLQPHVADHYVIKEISEQGIEDLYRVITGQPRLSRPPRGPVRTLPASGGGPQVVPLTEPPAVLWRNQLGVRIHTMTLEAHLLPVGASELIPVQRLTQVANELTTHARDHHLFPAAAPVAVDSSNRMASAQSTTGLHSSGIVVHRKGQRSAWSALSRIILNFPLYPGQVADRIVDLITMLLALDLPDPDRFTVAVGLERISGEGFGTPMDPTTIIELLRVIRQPTIRIGPEHAFTAHHLRRTVTEVAEGLAFRLTAAFRQEAW